MFCTEKVGGQRRSTPTGVRGSFGKERTGRWELGFSQWCVRGEEQNELFLALKRATSRRSGQRRDVTERLKPTSRRLGQRRDVTESGTKRRRDVTETHKNSRRDVDYSRREVPESIKIDVATLEIHVATLQRG